MRHLLLGVSDACPPREVVARLQTDRMSRRAHHAALGRPGLQRNSVIQAGGASRVVVRVATRFA